MFHYTYIYLTLPRTVDIQAVQALTLPMTGEIKAVQGLTVPMSGESKAAEGLTLSMTGKNQPVKGINDFDYTKDKNWSLRQGKSAHSTAICDTRNRFTNIDPSQPDTRQYAEDWSVLTKFRLKTFQIERWLINHANGFGLRNIPTLRSEHKDITVKALQEEMPLPTHPKTRQIIDAKFKRK